MSILIINAGSSSVKFAVYKNQTALETTPVLSGNIEGLEPNGQARLGWQHAGQKYSQALPAPTQSNDSEANEPFTLAFNEIAGLLASFDDLPRIRCVAHRVVHGGWLFKHSVIITPEVLTALAQFNELAPLHQPQNLAGIRSCQRAYPDVPHVACFDTAYHATMPELNYSFALPPEITDHGVRRYGFHGLSYQFIMSQLQQHSTRANGRVLMAHLGNGASLCAALEGRSLDTSMGFSALDGLMMGTRTGSLDPGVLLYLLAQGWDHDRLQKLLYKQSGLLGVSGLSADMRTLRDAASTDAKAQQAIDLFTHRIITQSGAMCSALRGLDVLAFSGGIGEHDSQLRLRVCRGLEWLGLRIDETLNQQITGQASTPIHAAESTIEVWVVPTDEALVMAKEAVQLLKI